MAVQDVLKLMNSPLNENSKLTIEESTMECAETSDYLDSDEEVNEVEDTLAYVISKIRNTSKKIRQSEVLTNRLISFCKTVNVPFLKPILDVVTRGNSTCDMLEVMYKLKPALSMLYEHCTDIKSFKLSECE